MGVAGPGLTRGLVAAVLLGLPIEPGLRLAEPERWRRHRDHARPGVAATVSSIAARRVMTATRPTTTYRGTWVRAHPTAGAGLQGSVRDRLLVGGEAAVDAVGDLALHLRLRVFLGVLF